MNRYFMFVVFCCAFFSCLSISSALISCGSDIFLQAGTFSVSLTSPGHPSYYPSGTCKKWRITAPSGKLVQLKFISFDLYGYPTCSKSSDDTLKIYDSFSESNLIGKYCGKYIPANVVSSGRYLYLVFYSNSKFFSPADRGFKLEYNAISDPGTDSSICSPFNSVFTNNYIRLTASSTAKYIQSPLYPAKYPSNIECVWYISASSSSKRIKLTVTNRKIYNYNMFSCSSASDYDFLKVKDGSSLSSSLLREMCSTSYSSTSVTSSGRYMTVQFKTNLDNYFDGATTGFKAEFVELDNSDSTGAIVGAIIGVIIVLVILIPCCICIVKRQRTSGQVVRHPPPVTTATTTTTTTTQYPMQPQAPVPPQGTYPQAGVSYPPPPAGGYPPVPPGSSYPPPGSSYPPPASSYPPPPGSSYPPAVQGSYPPPSDPPPQYPGPPAYPPQPQYNPQLASQPNPPYPPATQGSTNQQFQYPPQVDTKASAPPEF